MAEDISKKIRMCVDTGKTKPGERDAIKASLIGGGAKIIILSSNCKETAKSDIEHNARISGIPIYHFDGNGYELGSACGVPYVISALTVFDEGNSNILAEFAKEKD